MTSSSGDVLGLLRAAGAGPLSKPAAAPGGAVGAPGEGAFAELLRRAADGELISGVPISIDRDAGVKLSDDQLARLSMAADRAEAEGIQNAVAMIDGMALMLDVKTRTVTRQVDLSQGVLTGIDGIVTVPALGGNSTAALLPPGGRLAENPSLLGLLQERESAAATKKAG